MATKRRLAAATDVGRITRRRRPAGPMLSLHITLTAEAGKRVMKARNEGSELRTASDVIEDLVLGNLDGNGRPRRPGSTEPITLAE
jgi:hypothetical protein